MKTARLLCEGPCSLGSVPYARALQLAKDEVPAHVAELMYAPELNRQAMLKVARKLKTTLHKFDRIEKNDILFTCTHCGHERVYGRLRRYDNKIRMIYGLNTL